MFSFKSIKFLILFQKLLILLEDRSLYFPMCPPSLYRKFHFKDLFITN